MYIDNILPVSQSYQEPPGVSWNYCACPITRLIYPGLPKVKLILGLTHFALVNQLDHFLLLIICIDISVSNCTFIIVRINDTHTLAGTTQESGTFSLSFLEIFLSTITPSTFLHAFAPACILRRTSTSTRPFSDIFPPRYTQFFTFA